MTASAPECLTTPFRLGDRVTIYGTVKKVHDREGRTEYKAFNGPPWDYSGVESDNYRREYPQGVVVGKRSLQTGTTTYTDDGPVFRADGHVTVYVVAYSIHRKPALCFPGQIQHQATRLPGAES